MTFTAPSSASAGLNAAGAPLTRLSERTGVDAEARDRLEALRRRPVREHEARTVYWDTTFKVESVKLLPGEYFVHGSDLLLATTLGSCVAACIWDRVARVGGMNHFMLPEGDGGSARYGAYAMELLINEILKLGARRERLEAKIFGGGRVMSNFSTLNVGEQNVSFVERFLATERIAVASRDVLDVHPRKVCFFPASGRALVRKLPVAQAQSEVELEERQYRNTIAREASKGGDVELF